jgi:uncharacterized protein YtpQ (UPF0354 family)
VAGQWYFLDTSVSSTNDGHDIAEILLKEVLNNIKNSEVGEIGFTNKSQFLNNMIS